MFLLCLDMVERGRYPISRYLNIRAASLPQFYPDGRSVAFVTNITGIPQAWRVDVDQEGGEAYWPEQLTFESDRVQWIRTPPSPGDGRLLFGRDIRGNEKAQIYLLGEDGSEALLSEGHEEAMHIPGEWSEDGRILFAANRRQPGIFDAYLQPLDREARLIWENDDPGYLRDLSFSPDGKRALCSRIQSSFRNQLLEIDVEAGEARDLSPTREDAQYSTPCYSKDGNSVYVATDVGSDFLYLARLDLNTMELEELAAPGWDVEFLTVSPDGRYINYEVNVEGVSKLLTLDLDTGETMKADLGEVPGVVYDVPSFSGDSSKIAFSFCSATQPMDIHVWDLIGDGVFPVTRSSCGGLPPESFKAPELVHYPTFDQDEKGGTRMIPAWFFKSETEGKTPVIVMVHGGPENQARPTFDFRVQYFLQNGYTIFVPNVRGSTGYGKSYSHLDDVRKRMDSVVDLAQGARWLKGRPGVDGDRLVVAGGSYGGFMTLSAVTTYPDLWVAGVDIVGVSNLATFLKNTSDYRRKHREAEYGSLERDLEFLESIAPINHIEKIRAPMMVIQGRNDPRVPLSESEQMVEEMRRLGKPVEFIVFDDEGHGIVRLKNKIVAYTAIMEFLEKHVKIIQENK